MVRRKLYRLGWILLSVLAVGGHAWGEEDTRERIAHKACLSGEYRRGVEILSDLYLDTRDVTYLFNQGRCYEQNNRYEDALGRFREYLRKATNLDPALRAETEKHIAECEALAAKLGPDKAKAGASPAGSTGATVADGPGTPAGGASLVQPASQPTRAGDEGQGLRIAGLVCGGVGVVAVGAGIYFYTRGVHYSDKVSKTLDPSAADQQAGKDAETMQWVFYGIGGAALITGTTLYLLGRAQEHGGTTVAPVVGPSMAGLSVQGGF